MPFSLAALSLPSASHDLLGRARARASQAARQAEGVAARQALWVLGKAYISSVCSQPALVLASCSGQLCDSGSQRPFSKCHFSPSFISLI